MPDDRWLHCPNGWRLRCRVCRRTAEGVARAGLVQPGEEVYLLLELSAPGGVAAERPHLAVELWRGNECHHVRRQTVQETRTRLAWRLSFGSGEGRSSRLRCRILLDGQEAATAVVLQGRPAVDAQGRLPSAGQAASPATLFAYQEELQRQVDAGRADRP
jgi:hypothetical protein